VSPKTSSNVKKFIFGNVSAHHIEMEHFAEEVGQLAIHQFCTVLENGGGEILTEELTLERRTLRLRCPRT